MVTQPTQPAVVHYPDIKNSVLCEKLGATNVDMFQAANTKVYVWAINNFPHKTS